MELWICWRLYVVGGRGWACVLLRVRHEGAFIFSRAFVCCSRVFFYFGVVTGTICRHRVAAM